MQNVHKLDLGADISEHTIIAACILLGMEPNEDMTLICPFEVMEPALAIAKRYGMRLVFLPKEMLTRDHGNGSDTWGLRYKDSWVWSTGV